MYNMCTRSERAAVREQYIKLQDNRCWYCKGDLALPPPPEMLSKELNMWRFPAGFLTYPVHLHHSHVTGLTIGAVHAHCNGVLFQYEGQ